MKTARIVTALTAMAAGVGLMALPAVASGGAPEKVWVCHATSSDTRPYTIINVSTSSTQYEGHLAHRDHPNKTWKGDGTYGGVEHTAGQPKPDIIGEPGADVPPQECGPVAVVTESPVTQTVTAPPVTETVTAPPVTETETVTPTATVTVTGPTVTETETVTPTTTVTTTLPPVTTTETVTPPPVTETVTIPAGRFFTAVTAAPVTSTRTVAAAPVTSTVTGKPDRVIVDESGQVRSVQRQSLAYTGSNGIMLTLLGLVLLLGGSVLLLGRRLMLVRQH